MNYTFNYDFSGLHEFEAQKNHEVNEFRTKMRTFCEVKAQERQALPWQQWMEYSFPCDLEPCSSPPVCGSVKSKNTKKIFINVKFEACDVSRSAVVVFMSHTVCVKISRYDGAAHIESSTALIGKTVVPPCVNKWRGGRFLSKCEHLWKSPSHSTTFKTSLGNNIHRHESYIWSDLLLTWQLYFDELVCGPYRRASCCSRTLRTSRWLWWGVPWRRRPPSFALWDRSLRTTPYRSTGVGSSSMGTTPCAGSKWVFEWKYSCPFSDFIKIVFLFTFIHLLHGNMK